MFGNRFYPLVNQFDGSNDLSANIKTNQQVDGETNKHNKSVNNKWANRVKSLQNSQQQQSSSTSNSHRVFAASYQSKRNQLDQNQQQPDWQHILERIETYTQDFPPCDEEGIVHLQQGTHFIFCDQFVNTIRYGAELLNGMIVRNFIDCPNGFFNDLFQHVAKTQYPNKFIPLLSFNFAHSFPWPQCGLLVEIARHLEPKVLRKGETNAKVIVSTLTDTGQLIKRVQVQRKVQGTAQRVMYSLQNEKTGELFYLKIWFDPAQGDTKYKDMKGMTLRSGKASTQTTAMFGSVSSSA